MRNALKLLKHLILAFFFMVGAMTLAQDLDFVHYKDAIDIYRLAFMLSLIVVLYSYFERRKKLMNEESDIRAQ